MADILPLVLWVFRENHSARAFYEANGFALTDTLKPAFDTEEVLIPKEFDRDKFQSDEKKIGVFGYLGAYARNNLTGRGDSYSSQWFS